MKADTAYEWFLSNPFGLVKTCPPLLKAELTPLLVCDE